ncbi:cytochrome c [Mangrovicoccus sp. HB161399]|uniref:c-type cytochrome n=1 Tax=Mangrovicoccus sp. HB161399 TaxID=2720392 RepID=UPI001552FEC4|nr:cytochrome c [Mangrovicoccus sp. HB161399]
MARHIAPLAALALGLASAAAAQSADDLAARGAYIARAADCSACHTDPAGGEPFAGGYAIASPMGPIIATNITPSKTFGIGGWTEEEFGRALRRGVAPGGAHLYPAMPYPSYAKMADADVKALYAYFTQAVAPVEEAPAAQTELPFPFSQRALMIGWNLLFAPEPGWTAPAGLSEEEARGAYLADALEHCSTCHTPRGVLMNEQGARYLGGGSLGSWRAPNITPDMATGIGSWSRNEIVSYLRDGIAIGKGSAAGPMAEAVEHSLSHLEDSDLQAIAAYLKTVPAVSSPVDRAGAAEPLPVGLASYETTDWQGNPDHASALAEHGTTDGATLYNAACAACHGVDGQGAPDGHFPSLSAVSSVTSKDPSNLVMTIAEGISRHDAAGYTVMPGFSKDLGNAQIAALASYVTATFSGSDATVGEAEVATIRSGGGTPWLVRNAAWLTWAGIAAALLVAAAIVALIVRLSRRGAHAA